jgi:histone H3
MTDVAATTPDLSASVAAPTKGARKRKRANTEKKSKTKAPKKGAAKKGAKTAKATKTTKTAKTAKTAKGTKKNKTVKKAEAAPAEPADPETARPRKKRKNRPGKAAEREIRRLQKTTDTLIPKAPFRRLIREITQDFITDARWEDQALEAMQEASEAYLVGLLNNAGGAAKHAGRQCVMPADIQFVRSLTERGTAEVQF